MASDRLFEMLAQAKGQPSKALRATEAGSQAAEDILGGYLRGRQIKSQLQQPGAMAKLFSAANPDIANQVSPDVLLQAMYGATPKEGLDYLGKSSELKQRGALGYAGINERNTASKRAFDAANSRTQAQEDVASGRTLSGAISTHQQAINDLNTNMGKLASSVPSGIGATIQNILSKGGDVTSYLTDPKFGAVTAQMKQFQEQINNHKQILNALSQKQGLVPSGLSDNSDLGGINPSGGDTSIPGQGSTTSGVSIF